MSNSEELKIAEETKKRIKDKLIKEMVDRFLAWELPSSVCCDQIAAVQGAQGIYRCGTNLLTADEAEQMIRFIIEAKS